MKKYFYAAAVAVLFSAANDCLRGQDAKLANLLSNGDFGGGVDASGIPISWHNDAQGQVTMGSDGATRFVQLVSQQPDQLIQVSQAAALPPGSKGLDFSVRFRTSGVKFGANFQCDARLLFQFLGADNRPVKPGPGAVIFDSHAKSWTDLSRRFLIPEGAVQLRVMVCINKAASGTLDVTQVRLTPMSPVDVEALAMEPVLAAKKKTDDETEAQRMLTLPPRTAGIKADGNRLVTVAGGKSVILQGVNVPSLEWSAKGENVLQSVKVALVEWKANVVRLPVMDSFWFGQGKPPQTSSNDAEAYRKLIDDVVTMAAGQGAYVVLDLHRFHRIEERDVTFWKDAAARYKDNPAVLFDLFNEPDNMAWEVWRNGGEIRYKLKKGETEAPAYPTVGMQALVNAVRGTGARNLVIAGGIGNAYDLSGILQGFALDDRGGNGIMYATHFYNWHHDWQKHFLTVAAKYPVLVGEFGADIKKMPFVAADKQEDPLTWVPDALGLVQQYHLNWTAFCLHPKSTPVLINDWSYEPTPFWGVFAKRALAGEHFDLKKTR